VLKVGLKRTVAAQSTRPARGERSAGAGKRRRTELSFHLRRRAVATKGVTAKWLVLSGKDGTRIEILNNMSKEREKRGLHE